MFLLLATLLPTLLAFAGLAAESSSSAEMEPPAPSPTLERILGSDALDAKQRQALQLFHGRWDDLSPRDPREASQLAWAQYRLNHPSLQEPLNEQEPQALIEAAVFRGATDAALRLLDAACAEIGTYQAAWLRAEALTQAGRLPEAVTLLAPLRGTLQHEPISDAAELTAAARVLVMLAELEGRPSQDYHLALALLGRATQEIDPLYWPAHLAEAELLMTKDNRQEAAAAVDQTLSLNPHAGQAWYLLGRLAVDGYNFDAAAEASKQLRQVNPLHPLADLLDLRSFLRQRDVASARRVLEPALAQMPHQRELLALAAATEAMAYRDDALDAALARFDKQSPGSPLALYTAGEYLATDRQYAPAADLLRQAIERSPNWPAPRLELGLLLMQAGDLVGARAELAAAARLDPFHSRVNNQLRLAESLLGDFRTLETPHFVIRYRPGVDEVLARDMPGPLEDMHRELTSIFQYAPTEKTQIDLMPDKSTFAVRITGMPHIWTIAAATGDVISLTPPRSGRDQADPFNWVNVLRHELVHTITLAQTRNRVPHWFTEACAVSVETTGRTYDTCQLLAWAVNNDKLFAYDKINWGFVRPQTERDRPLAYAQADWMLEFIAARWSHQAIVDLLELYRQGVSDTDALREVTGLSAESFMADFTAYARQEVDAWGLSPRKLDEAGQKLVDTGGRDATVEEIEAALASNGQDHPALLKILAERFVDGGLAEQSRHWLHRYAAARPVDPWPHKALVKLAYREGQPAEALGSLQELERSENYSSAWSRQIAQLHQQAGRFDLAMSAALRALQCEPYNAELRELAATIALQAGNWEAAAYHVEALVILEPDRPQHAKRLAIIRERLAQEK